MIKLIILHFIADFLLQSREMGKKKSEEIKWLAYHLLIQFLIFLPFTSFKFSLVNALIHGLIDWNIWKAYKSITYFRLTSKKERKYTIKSTINMRLREFKYWEDHLFYSTIGFDQSLHMATLYTLFYINL